MQGNYIYIYDAGKLDFEQQSLEQEYSRHSYLQTCVFMLSEVIVLMSLEDACRLYVDIMPFCGRDWSISHFVISEESQNQTLGDTKRG